MYSKRLGFALATIVAVALSAVAHAAPVNLEQTQIMLVVGDQANVDSAFEPMIAGVELQPVSDEVGWRNLSYRF
jgi:hypothetical protein